MTALLNTDAVFEALHRRHPEYVLPGYASSPMDDRSTVVLPRLLIELCEPAASGQIAEESSR